MQNTFMARSDNPVDQEMAKRLIEARKKANYRTASDGARAMGISIPTYLGHENGSRGFLDDARRYAQFFKCNYEWLITGAGGRRKGAGNVLEDLDPEKLAEVMKFIEWQRSKDK